MSDAPEIRRQRADLEGRIRWENIGEIVRRGQRIYRRFRFNTMTWCSSEQEKSEMLSNNMEITK